MRSHQSRRHRLPSNVVVIIPRGAEAWIGRGHYRSGSAHDESHSTLNQRYDELERTTYALLRLLGPSLR